MASSRPIAVLFGTRPEAIKLAPVILELRRRRLATVVLSTGQHAEMVRQALVPFAISVDHDLGLMQESQSLDYLLSATISGVGRVLEAGQPGAVVVQGDTTSSLGGSLASFHARVPVAHVEAGLRSGNLSLPFPEEMNRRLTSQVAYWHFAPTEAARENLRREGVTERVHVCGNTVVDALQQILAQEHALPDELERFVSAGPMVLATAHRRESWNGGIARVASALRTVLGEFPELRLIFATHPNPVAREPVERAFRDEPRARMLPPLEYPAFLHLLGRARLAITDSGGVQEEGPTMGVPVLVTREVTERPEGLAAGAVRLVATDERAIVDSVRELLRDDAARDAMANAGRRIYGDGRAAQRIVDVLGAALA